MPTPQPSPGQQSPSAARSAPHVNVAQGSTPRNAVAIRDATIVLRLSTGLSVSSEGIASIVDGKAEAAIDKASTRMVPCLFRAP